MKSAPDLNTTASGCCRFLWFVLKDRNFDESAVADLAHLKQELQLSSDDVAEVFRERCKRIEKKFGNLILPAGGARSPHVIVSQLIVDYTTAE